MSSSSWLQGSWMEPGAPCGEFACSAWVFSGRSGAESGVSLWGVTRSEREQRNQPYTYILHSHSHMSWLINIKRKTWGGPRCQILFLHLQGKIQFPKANTSPQVKTITRVCLFYIIEQCWRESLDAKTSLSCLTTLAHVLNEKVMALKHCQHPKTAIFICGLGTDKRPRCILWVALVFCLRGGKAGSGVFFFYLKNITVWHWRLVETVPCPIAVCCIFLSIVNFQLQSMCPYIFHKGQ